MNVLIFGASGMVGQGVMHESLAACDVDNIYVVGRRPLLGDDKRITQVICEDFKYLPQALDELPKIDACFFCLGQSSSGMTEQQYRTVTFDLTLSAANALQQNNPDMTFVYVSGAGTDSTEKGKSMWARVKGETENALLKIDFAHVYLFRPAIIQPLNGIRSKTASYRILYQLMAPIFPVLKRCFPNHILTTSDIGVAMLDTVRQGYQSKILEVKDIANLARQ